jgi:amino acid permease
MQDTHEMELSSRRNQHSSNPLHETDSNQNSCIDEKYEKKVRIISELKASVNGRVNYDALPTSEHGRHTSDESLDNESQLPITSLTSPSHHHHQSPVFTSFINLTSTVIGAGILGLPYAFSKIGWLLGTFSLFFAAFLAYFALHLLAECVKKVPATIPPIPFTFYTIADLAIPQYSKYIDFAIMLKGIGVATSYLIVITDSLPKAAHPFVSTHTSEVLFDNRFNCLLLSYIFVLPISYFPSLESLKYSSLISFLMILFLVFLIFLYSLQLNFDGLNPCEGTRSLLAMDSSSLSGFSWFSEDRRLLTTENLCEGKTYVFPFFSSIISSTGKPYQLRDFFQVFPIFLFSYTCHQNTYNIIQELERPTAHRISFVFSLSIFSSLFLYVIISYSAYLTFGDLVSPDILTSYPGVLYSCSSRVVYLFCRKYPHINLSFFYGICNCMSLSVTIVCCSKMCINFMAKYFTCSNGKSLEVHRVHCKIFVSFFNFVFSVL